MRDALLYLAGILILVGAAWLCLWAVSRAIRRRWQRLVAATIGGFAGEGVRIGLRWAASQPFTSPRWWRMQSQRHRMWRSVSSATRAVAQVQAAGASTGDLPRLAADLEHAAADIDRVLLAASHGPSGRGANQQAYVAVHRDLPAVLTAAKEIHEIALLALGEHASPSIEALSSAVRIESDALRAGWDSARRGRMTGAA